MLEPSTNNVTLLAISSIELPETLRVLEMCADMLPFGAVKLITHKFVNPPVGITVEYCPEIKDIMDFNHYVFSGLYKHVQTSHCLMVQYHAWIVRPDLWANSWLNYDYIGAPWPVKEGSYIADNGERVRVGNGGFSLRSRKLMELPMKLNLPLKEEQGYYNEDGNICCYHRSTFLKHGIKYAPLDVATRFAFENEVPENQNIPAFGFHRKYR